MNVIRISVFREDGRNGRRMRPGNKLEAASLAPQRKHCNMPVKLRPL